MSRWWFIAPLWPTASLLLLLLLTALAQPAAPPQPQPSQFPVPFSQGHQRLAGPYLPAAFHCQIDPVRDVVVNWVDHPSFFWLDLVGLFYERPLLAEVGILCGPSFAPEPRLDSWRPLDLFGNSIPSATATRQPRLSRYQPHTTVFRRATFGYPMALSAWRQQNATLSPTRLAHPLVPLVSVLPQFA